MKESKTASRVIRLIALVVIISLGPSTVLIDILEAVKGESLTVLGTAVVSFGVSLVTCALVVSILREVTIIVRVGGDE